MHMFYLEPEKWPKDACPALDKATKCSVELAGQEGLHLAKVLRLRPGTEVGLLSGDGFSANAVVEEVHRDKATLHLTSVQRHPRPESRMILSVGWGKAARRGWILEKAVELEAGALWLWHAERSQFPLPADIKQNWQAQLVAGAKQCHNPFLPSLRLVPEGVAGLVALAAQCQHNYVLVEADYQAEDFVSEKYLGLPGDTQMVIGPEGGFSPQEVEILRQHGFTCLTMGKRILRWETAALMALGLHFWKRQERA